MTADVSDNLTCFLVHKEADRNPTIFGSRQEKKSLTSSFSFQVAPSASGGDSEAVARLASLVDSSAEGAAAESAHSPVNKLNITIYKQSRK